MTLTVLGIDPSAASTGWACGPIGGMPKTGSLRFADKGSAEDVVGAAALRWIVGKLNEYQPDCVAIEAPIFSSSGAQSSSVALLKTINDALRIGVFMKTGKSALKIAPSTARKILTGKGRYDTGQAKPVVFAKCLELGWIDVEDPYDVSDACAIWAAAAVNQDPAFAASFTPLGQKSGVLV